MMNDIKLTDEAKADIIALRGRIADVSDQINFVLRQHEDGVSAKWETLLRGLENACDDVTGEIAEWDV